MIETESEYWGIRSDHYHVEAWSAVRPPFEPRGWQLAFRQTLRVALRLLRATEGQVLCAEYETPDDDFADLENVLLYNVGSGVYGHLVANGMSLQRAPSRDKRHRLTYRVAPPPNPVRSGTLLATVHTPLGLGVAAPHSAGTWWRLLRPAIATPEPRIEHAGEFTVDVEIGGLQGARSVAGMVKPLLDGLISALHVQRPATAYPNEQVRSRLALLGDPQDLWALLIDDSAAALGPRSLVRPGKTNLVWNPADDRCSAISVTSGAAADPQIAAAVHAVP